MYLVFDLVSSGKASFADKVKVSRRADATGGSTMNLRTGEVVTLDELMRGMAVARATTPPWPWRALRRRARLGRAHEPQGPGNWA